MSVAGQILGNRFPGLSVDVPQGETRQENTVTVSVPIRWKVLTPPAAATTELRQNYIYKNNNNKVCSFAGVVHNVLANAMLDSNAIL